jgi:hypothetical protein
VLAALALVAGAALRCCWLRLLVVGAGAHADSCSSLMRPVCHTSASAVARFAAALLLHMCDLEGKIEKKEGVDSLSLSK